jgi:hypothetical protein
MTPFDKDWVFAQVAAQELQDYLLSNTLYWPVTGSRGLRIETDQPRFTIGNLLLSLQRLAAGEWTGKQQQELAETRAYIQQMRQQWRSHWSKKAKEEFASRLPRLQSFVTSLGSENPPSAHEYAYQIRNRVILDLLLKEIDEPLAVEQAALSHLDATLRRWIRPGAFVWDEAIRDQFPSDRYWYLYGAPSVAA